jgi:hypothetical protein
MMNSRRLIAFPQAQDRASFRLKLAYGEAGRARFRKQIAAVGINLFAAISFMNSAVAQIVLIPQGDYENDFEKYLVAIISLVLLCFAAWRFYRSRR